MHLLALCLICGIASMCFGVAYWADAAREQGRINRSSWLRAEDLEDQLFKTKRVLEATQKAVDALAGTRAINDEAINNRLDDLASRFESHKGSLQAHKKLPKGRAR